MPSTFKVIDALTSTAATTTSSASSVAAAALASLSTTYRYNNTILLPSLEERLQTPLPPQSTSTASSYYPATSTYSISPLATSSSSSVAAAGASEINSSTGLTSISHVASVVVSNFLPLSSASLSSSHDDVSTSAVDTKLSSSTSTTTTSNAAAVAAASVSSASSSMPMPASTTFFPSYSPPVVESLVASSAEEFSNNFRDLSFDIFDDNDNDLFGSPLAFDASENGLWNGRFVPPPPRPPFFVDEPVLSDGLTTCDLCSWAMPTKSTFIFEGTMEKASELGWPLTLTIVSILSAILGAIIMIAVVKCRRKKTSHQRSDTHVQWWSRNKRPNGNNNHLRRSNIYTAHPADSIRGLQQPNSLSASSSMTAMTTAMTVPPTVASSSSTQQMPYYHTHTMPIQHVLGNQQQHQPQQQQQQQQYLQQFEHEHEYHQPQELQLQLQPQQQQHFNHLHNHHQHPHHNNLLNHHHHHLKGATLHGGSMMKQNHGAQHQHSASMSSSSTNSMPSLSSQPLQMQIPEQIHLQSSNQPQHVHNMQHNNKHHALQHQQQQHQHQQHQPTNQMLHQHEPDLELEQHQESVASPSSSSDLHDNMFHWPTATSIVTS